MRSGRSAPCVYFWAKPEHAVWTTNARRYSFGPFVQDGISLFAKKEPDHSFIVEVAGPFSQPFYFRAATPVAGPQGVEVMLTWKDRNITLYLNGKSVETGRGLATLVVASLHDTGAISGRHRRSISRLLLESEPHSGSCG